jgi:DNA-binding transcriptional ArsR family regulator
MNADMKASEPAPDSQYVELAVEVFAMLADATRVRMILALRDGELPVNALAEIAEKSPASVSQHLAKMRLARHLAKMRLARLVATRQEGTKVFYRLQNAHVWQLVADAIHQAEHSLGTAPNHGMAPHAPREAGE